jgi:hypothetical protein
LYCHRTDPTQVWKGILYKFNNGNKLFLWDDQSVPIGDEDLLDIHGVLFASLHPLLLLRMNGDGISFLERSAESALIMGTSDSYL